MTIKILLSGDGGQGIQLISDMLAQTAFRKGMFVTQLPNYGLEQRGGVSLSFLQISNQEIVYPKFSSPDILLVMSEQARLRTKNYCHEGIQIIDVIDYQEKLKEPGIKEQSYNIFFLGQLANILEKINIITKKETLVVLEEKLSKKSNWEENKNAFNLV